jgi:hypothetical protein
MNLLLLQQAVSVAAAGWKEEVFLVVQRPAC